MLGEFKVSRCSRQCFVEKRPLKEGETYFSVVVDQDGELERRDYCADAWQGPPEGCVGSWKNRMPVSGEKKLVLAPREVLIDLLRQMESDPDQSKIRYLLALLLLRKRMVRLGSPVSGRQESREAEAAGHAEEASLHLQVIEDGSTIQVAQCPISQSESESLSEVLNELLYCEASEMEEDRG